MGELLEALILTISIRQITHQWIAEMLEMHSDLVSASRVQDRFGKSRAVQSFEHAIRCPRLPAKLFMNGHPFAMGRMPGDGCPDLAALPRHLASDQSRVV